eukprot:SAG25_NODE_179_length_12643_cov_55.630660_5_plen_85_part_00
MRKGGPSLSGYRHSLAVLLKGSDCACAALPRSRQPGRIRVNMAAPSIGESEARAMGKAIIQAQRVQGSNFSLLHTWSTTRGLPV